MNRRKLNLITVLVSAILLSLLGYAFFQFWIIDSNISRAKLVCVDEAIESVKTIEKLKIENEKLSIEVHNLRNDLAGVKPFVSIDKYDDQTILTITWDRGACVGINQYDISNSTVVHLSEGFGCG